MFGRHKKWVKCLPVNLLKVANSVKSEALEEEKDEQLKEVWPLSIIFRVDSLESPWYWWSNKSQDAERLWQCPGWKLWAFWRPGVKLRGRDQVLDGGGRADSPEGGPGVHSGRARAPQEGGDGESLAAAISCQGHQGSHLIIIYHRLDVFDTQSICPIKYYFICEVDSRKIPETSERGNSVKSSK